MNNNIIKELNDCIINYLDEIKIKNNDKKINISELLKVYYKYINETKDNMDYSKFVVILEKYKIIKIDNSMTFFNIY
jgi:hypothetical protein